MSYPIDQITKTGESILSSHFGERLFLQPVRVWDGVKSTVVRCSVQPGSPSRPSTVIVKHSKCNSALEDWAASEFLSTLSNNPPLAPSCFGGDGQSKVIVLEDLGEGMAAHTLELLKGNDPVLAADALVNHIRLLGRLHSETRGK